MGSPSAATPGAVPRGAFWAADFSGAPQAHDALARRFASQRATISSRHPQAFGNYFTYGAAASILGIDPRAVFPSGSLDLAPRYCDFAYMWCQLGPPAGAMAALAAPLSPNDITPYAADLPEPLRDLAASAKLGRARGPAFDVLGTEGAQGALGYAFLTFLGPGDEVLVTDPAYMSFGPGPEIAGATVRTIPLSPANRFRLDPDEVEWHLTPRTKMLVLCDPINPFGVVQTREELLAIARLCERRNVLILNNITHGTHRTNPLAVHTPMPSLAGETGVDHVLCVTGLSKGYALAALRLGFMGGHPALLRLAARVRMEITGIHIHPFAHRAAMAALPDTAYVAQSTEVLRRNLQHLRATLRAGGEVRLAAEPDYGFCACLDVSDTDVSAQELTVALFKQGICVIAGDALGEVGATRYVRINYSALDIGNLDRLRHALPLALGDARSGCYLQGVRAFYRARPGARARRILAQLEDRRAPKQAAGARPSTGRHPGNESPGADVPRQPRRSIMGRDKPPPFVSQIELRYGPFDVLGPFFADAYQAASDYGVHVALGTFEELLDVNLANQASWRAIIPTFDPRFSDLEQETSFCLLGYDRQGDVVATQACRLFNWRDTSFFEAARDLTLFYARPELDRRPGETCEITAQAARNISGRVAFSGAGWYRPDFRGGYLSLILPRISRALAFTRWSTDYTASMFQDRVLAGGMAERCGYTNIDWKVHVKGSPMGDILFAFVWMEPDELVEDLRGFKSLIDSKVDRRVRDGRA